MFYVKLFINWVCFVGCKLSAQKYFQVDFFMIVARNYYYFFLHTLCFVNDKYHTVDSGGQGCVKVLSSEQLDINLYSLL